MSMTDIKTDPTLAEWIGIHDELKNIRQEQIWIRDQIRDLNLNLAQLQKTIQIVADREF